MRIIENGKELLVEIQTNKNKRIYKPSYKPAFVQVKTSKKHRLCSTPVILT